MGDGVVLDPHYGARDARGYRGDELYFDGYDIGQARHGRRTVYDYGEESDGLDYRDQRGRAYQDAVREKEDTLYQSALGRIARANAKGKTNVSLSREEMEALERRRNQQPEPTATLASPPATPAKPATPKGKPGSRSNSSSNLSGQKARSGKRASSGLFSGSSSSPAKSNSKAKVSRKPSDEQTAPYPTGAQPPGIMVPGPNGTPVFAPISYYPPPSPEYTRSPGGSKAGSRSGSKHSRRESTPPERTDAAGYAYPPRYYPPASLRPESAHSNRSLPDDIDWYPPPPPPAGRNRSSSSATSPYAAYPPPAEYDPPLALPAAQGQRRNMSGAPDVRYASLRRVAPSSPLAPRRGSLLAQQTRDVDASSSSSSDDQGVQVDIVADAAGGYSISRAPAAVEQARASAAPSGNEGRRRKGRR